MKFKYTALSSDNKKLIGVLEAASLDTARASLHKMDLVIVNIFEVTSEEYEDHKNEEQDDKESKGIKTYNFRAINTERKEVNGTIDALDDYLGYKRLVVEYQLKVKDFYPDGSSEAQKEEYKNKLVEFEKYAKAENINAKKKNKEGDKDVSKQMDKKLKSEINKVIRSSKKVIGEHKDFFTPALLKHIEKTLGNLERIRNSNNIKHITGLSKELYDLISHPDKLPEETDDSDTSQNYKEMLDEIGNSALLTKEFDIYKKAIKFRAVQMIFGKIKKKLSQLSNLSEHFEENTNVQEKDRGKFVNAIIRITIVVIVGIKRLFSKQKSSITHPVSPNPFAAKSQQQNIVEKLSNLFREFLSFITAKNSESRNQSKQELKKIFRDLFRKNVVEATPPVTDASSAEIAPKLQPSPITQRKVEDKISPFFTEISNFIGWLLFFYIIFFFLVDFSIEKDIGLSQEFVIKALKTPLILNITILLLFIYIVLYVKCHYLRRSFLGSIFLFLLGFSSYTLLIINF